MSYVFQISKPTYNVLTETNPDNLIFSSNYNSFKYYATGELDLYVDDGDREDTATVAHNLGYIPFFVAYCIPSATRLGTHLNEARPMPYRDIIQFDGYNWTNVYGQAYADSTNFGCVLQALDGVTFSFSLQVFYKIFKNDSGL